MLPRKSAAVFSSCAGLTPRYHNYTCPSLRPPCTPPSCRHTCSRLHHARQARTYARHTESPWARGDADLLTWPDPVKPHLTPTPYQILRCTRGAAYSKSRFYALVKLYHPDRCHLNPALAHIPLNQRLERYRLLVTAHDILSDTEKRRAYDIWGHGWAGHYNALEESHQRQWASDPRYNATWEDWERWRHETDGTKAAEAPAVEMSNFAFISLILAFLSLGGVVQKTRLTTFSSSAIEKRDQIHREASIELRRTQDASTSGNRDGRIQTFVEHRESNITGDGPYERLIPPAENSPSDNISRE